MEYVKENVSKLAHDHVLSVKFKKVNGEERVMKCTLIRDMLPPQKDIEEHSTRENPNVLAVWDIDSNGWRSFRMDSIISLDVL